MVGLQGLGDGDQRHRHHCHTRQEGSGREFHKTWKHEANCTSFISLCLQFQVLRNDMKNVIRLMIEEVKNLRSQVRIVLYVSLKNIFEHDELTLSTESILKKD